MQSSIEKPILSEVGMKKVKVNLLAVAVFTALLLAAIIPFARIVFAPSPPQTFNVTLSITNVAPTITAVQASASFAPVEDAQATIYLWFNASDSNGASDMDRAAMNISVNGTNKINSSCTVAATAGNLRQYNCSFKMDYFDQSSASWVMNATINDSTGNSVRNDSITMTYQVLTAIKLDKTSISFSGAPGTNGVAASNNPLAVRDTGNDNFFAVNLTAFDLNGTTQKLGSGNFTVNKTNTATGQALTNNTMLNVTSATISRGNNTNSTLYFYVDIPSGLSDPQFNSSKDWSITVSGAGS